MSVPGETHEREPDFTQRFLDATASVEEYNLRNSGPGLLIRAFQVLAQAPGLAEGIDEAMSLADEADIDRGLVGLLHKDVLAEMGIGILEQVDDEVEFKAEEEVQEPLTMADGLVIEPDADIEDMMEGARGMPPKLLMYIADNEKFQTTVENLNPALEQHADTREKVTCLLDSWVHSIEQAVLGETYSGGADTEVNQVLEAFDRLNPVLINKDLQGGWSYEVLAEYLVRQDNGSFADYIGAKAEGILPLISLGYDMADINALTGAINLVKLRERWTTAFDYLKTLRDREEPGSFFTELFDNLRSGFDLLATWTDYQAGLTVQEAGGQWLHHYQQDLKQAMDGLAAVWEQDFPLENAYFLSQKDEINRGQPK